MSGASDGFTVHETHGILFQPGFEIGVSSDKRGWSSLYASVQREVPYEGLFDFVDDQLIVLHLDGPATVHRRIPKGEDSHLIPRGGMTMMPGGMDFRVRLGEPLLHASSLSPSRLARRSRRDHAGPRPNSYRDPAVSRQQRSSCRIPDARGARRSSRRKCLGNPIC